MAPEPTGYPILDRITGAWKARGRPLQEGLEEGLTVQNITDLANTGSFNTRGSWKLSLLFKDAHPVGTHRRCEHDQVWQEIYPGPYRCHVPEAIWPVESAIERLDSMESAATTRIDSKAKTVTIQQPDLTVIFHAANASIGEHTARIALSNTLSELGIPVLDIVAPSPTEHSSAPHEYTFGRYIGLEQFMSMTPAEMHLYLVGIIGPYAAKARRAAYACRNQSETYQGPWWSQDGNQTAEAMSCVPDVLRITRQQSYLVFLSRQR
ncbi:hypothetical protein H2203_007891 [Taxawa tesnikishii (nom. ined.)]|nr:hypothetical protein H2203_007891 [Dothideales sp. JES 119]